MTQQAHHFETPVTHALDYYLHLPKDYAIDNTQSWPLILFLHGMGERGDGGAELERVKLHGPPKFLDEKPEFPFVVVSPQCPANSWWPYEIAGLKALIDHILENYAVDPDRVYLTGLSMGGYGAWALSTVYPELFAAVAPICGGGIPPMTESLKDVPVWTFHGDADDVVDVSQSEEMVNALKSFGGDVKFTVYPGVGHDSWTQTYENPELYDWFLSHTRKAKT